MGKRAVFVVVAGGVCWVRCGGWLVGSERSLGMDGGSRCVELRLRGVTQLPQSRRAGENRRRADI